jgi:hypothetical protein
MHRRKRDVKCLMSFGEERRKGWEEKNKVLNILHL